MEGHPEFGLAIQDRVGKLIRTAVFGQWCQMQIDRARFRLRQLFGGQYRLVLYGNYKIRLRFGRPIRIYRDGSLLGDIIHTLPRGARPLGLLAFALDS